MIIYVVLFSLRFYKIKKKFFKSKITVNLQGDIPKI